MTEQKSYGAKTKVPHTLVIIFLIIVFCSILTYIVPAGKFEYVEQGARKVIDPASFHLVDAKPIGIYDFLNAIPTGMVKMASLIFFVFIAGGTFAIINETKTLEIAINKLAKALEGKEKFMIFVVMAVFSILGCVMGFAAEAVIFVPIGVALARKVGYDSIVGTGMVLMGSYAGFVTGEFNPYTTAVAQSIVDVPLFSGLGLRVAMHVCVIFAVSLYTIRYAERVKKNMTLSYVYELEQQLQNESTDLKFTTDSDFTIRHILVLLTMLCGFSIVIYGGISKGWGTSQMAPVFFGMGVTAGIVGGMYPNSIAKAWLKGAQSMTFAALVIGMGRGVLEVLQGSSINDTIINAMASVLKCLPSSLIAIGMLVCHSVINFFIPSGSGQATVTMPIMGPLAQLTGVSAQTAVLAFQCGDGFTNAIVPTSSVMNSCIGMAKIDYLKWMRYAFPLVMIELGIGVIFLVIAGFIGY
ncbi:MAG: AbgT family transporter [Synergistes jonesii]|uniref:YfcC family protein n=1 Tax=Synergistes jonesii TaxID=2754 RepID=UPI002A747FE0|nr:AbgT family transporter [Synergistes jonesii]MDY2983713.1 AbgT family transporter [Synergistes jonesii]